jgi:hypothetical protein
VGHAGTTVTEAVYRKELRPVLTDGADVMDRIFGTAGVRLPLGSPTPLQDRN